MYLLCFINRYKDYLEAKEQKIEMLKAIDDKLNECERFHKAHKVECSICAIFLLFVSKSIQLRNRSFAINGPQVWHMLPALLSALDNYMHFKHPLKSHFV